jgi:hypothetical protein
MKITREKLIAMWGLVNRLVNEKTAVKFHYLMLKNKKLLEPEVESLQKANTPPEGHNEFNKKRLDLCNSFADKEEDGSPKIINDNFVISEETKEEFEKKLSELKEEYKDVVDTMDKNQEDFIALLKEEVEIELAKIPLSIMPEAILGRDVELLFDIIDEDC